MSKTHQIPSTTFKTFDLPDFVEEIPQEFLRMRVSQSYAWRIDTLIVQAVRSLFKLVRDEARTGELDDATDYNLALAEQTFAEECFEQIGSDSAGPVRTLHELLDLRQEAHDLAFNCTRSVLDYKGQLRTYAPPQLDELFKAQGTMKPKAATVAKMKHSAERNAAKVATGKDAIEMAERILARKMAKEKNRLADMGEAIKAQTGALEQMFRIAVNHRPDSLPKKHAFHQINLELQRTLILATKQAIAQALGWAESDNSIDEEFDDICIASEVSTDTLDKVMKSPRFNCGVDGNAPIKEKITPLPTQTERKVLPKPVAKPTTKKRKLTVKTEPLPVAAPASTPAPAEAPVTADSMFTAVNDI